ncbi:Uu.00g127620.m01.CDS01 [Anthostomella pinea]|uniref:Uu.00g127620.m01.CDS01 n=1 Tax=Anthostomella pinea TaxID=933095 RepID=A0AAI8YFH4_9PEZI|nr:Uu.00g127620.m01.CDS01 [Anthostomella pinea]
MSYKRTRADFEADLQAQQSPYVLFGTPLPPLDPEVRDDGSYVPVWKQEVRDERGRKRLHGAFTGGFSAGYFNTVGSKEGWTPSTFVSSRTNRHKQDDAKNEKQRIEDFMDEEDLVDAAEAEKLQTAQGFAGLGSTEDDGLRRRGLADLFRSQGETMGVKLLRRMGWKDGQGIGPKVRRKARLDVGGTAAATKDGSETHLFAPENVSLIAFVRKLDRKGLGYEGESRLASIGPSAKTEAGESSDEETRDEPLRRPGAQKKKNKFAKGGIGMGILNDNGSDDEDPYEIGPKISYNRIIGGDKKKKKASTTPVNPALRSAPVFISRKNALAKAGKNLKKCHDGRLPLDGFVFGTEIDTLTSAINLTGKYPPPEIPPDWKSSKQRKAEAENSNYVSTADAAKASSLDPKSRAALLGEAQLPGKSVFDFLSPEARERLASATGKSNLPPAMSEIPAEYALTDAERQQELIRQLPELDKHTAIAAITRGAGGAAPYADNEGKRGRYRAYLEYAAGFNKALPTKPSNLTNEAWVRELHEFHSCARIFKPMTGMMASRFTTSSSSANKLANGSSGTAADQELLSKPTPNPKDPAEEAAKLGMYGAMTRSVADFYPTRLLCKRFNVRPPAHVQPDPEAESKGPPKSTSTPAPAQYAPSTGFAEGAMTLDELMKQAQESSTSTTQTGSEPTKDAGPTGQPAKAEVNADVNEALEGKRAQDDVLKAIFGDCSDDEE